MSVSKRVTPAGSERWDVRLRQPDGSAIRRSFRSKAEAQRWERAQLVARDRGEHVDLRRAGAMTMAELADAFLARPGIAPRTVAQHRSTWRRHIEPTLGRRRVASVARADVQRLASAWSAGAAPSTVHRRHAVLSAMFSLAVDLGVISASPASRVRLPTVRPTQRRLPTMGELTAAAAAAPRSWAPMVWVAALAGLRWGEAAGLQVGDVDVLRRELHVRRTVGELSGRLVVSEPKRGSKRRMAIPAVLAELLADHMAHRGLTAADSDAWLFVGEVSGEALNYSSWWAQWRRVCTEAGVDGLGFHDLRRLNATLLVGAGVDVKTAQHRLGHADVAMTLGVYAQATADADRAAADRLGELMQGPRVTSVSRGPAGL